MIIKPEFYPEASFLMGVVRQIHPINEESFTYDIHFGITGIKDEKNVPEEDLKLYE